MERSMDISRLRKVSCCLLAGGALAMAALVCSAQDTVENSKEACSLPRLKDAVRVDGYIFRTYKGGEGNNDNCLQVSHNGKIIFRRTLFSSWKYVLGQPEEKKWKIPGIPNGTDITGRGRPDMIVSFYSGGAHCCNIHYVFELEPEFKLLKTLDVADTETAYFADLDRNHHFFFIAEDWTFAYWWVSFAGSPIHSVVLRFVDDLNGGGFHLDLDKMSRPAPTPEEWKAMHRDVDGELELNHKQMFNNLPDILWQKVIDLIYTGHSDLAWKFLDEVDPHAQLEPYPDLAAFCMTLKSSPYWPDLEPSIKNMPPACVQAKPNRK